MTLPPMSRSKMPTQRSLPFLHKVSNLLSILHKLRKPIIPELKKLRKRKLLRHYNYNGFPGDYQFSPSTTPLIHYHRSHFTNRGNRDLCSFFYLYWCLGNSKVEDGSGTWECHLEALPVLPNEDAIDVAEDLLDAGDEAGESVDQRAERFIERFYQEMRMQRQESI